MKAFLRFTFPVPVSLNRFLALEFVFILGITAKLGTAKIVIFSSQGKNLQIFLKNAFGSQVAQYFKRASGIGLEKFLDNQRRADSFTNFSKPY
ncbi:MAG: hypothetical protein WBB36_00785 [Chitinophagales bacterium]